MQLLFGFFTVRNEASQTASFGDCFCGTLYKFNPGKGLLVRFGTKSYIMARVHTPNFVSLPLARFSFPFFSITTPFRSCHQQAC